MPGLMKAPDTVVKTKGRTFSAYELPVGEDNKKINSE